MIVNILYTNAQQEEKRWAFDEDNEDWTFFMLLRNVLIFEIRLLYIKIIGLLLIKFQNFTFHFNGQKMKVSTRPKLP